MRSYEIVDKGNDEWLRSDTCELGFQPMTDTDKADATAKQR
jgi:hypothetical protein